MGAVGVMMGLMVTVMGMGMVEGTITSLITTMDIIMVDMGIIITIMTVEVVVGIVVRLWERCVVVAAC